MSDLNKQGEARPLDLIALGRAVVDLYGEQAGGRLEDVASFARYVGGSPTNSVIGAARLGLRTGLVTRVGGDHMGRFIREELAREGVSVAGVRTDPARLTGLVLLGLRDPETFPLLFYRENCADMALCADDIDPAFVASAGALLVNGTHLSTPGTFAASRKAAEAMKASGGRVIFDVDYRPVLWGLAPRDMGEDRFVADGAVTAALQAMLPLCDLVVGTEEEVHILGGATDSLAALRAIRAMTGALIVCKRGPEGCVAFEGAIPDSLEDGIAGPGFPVEVFNVLGAGDAFMAGFLRGWLRDMPVARCCEMGNACGAIVVSRHGCAPAMPSWAELEAFLARRDWPHRLRDSAALEQIHWASTRHGRHEDLCVLAIDHRAQIEALADSLGVERGRIAPFKALALAAVDQVAAGNPGFGMLLDGTYGARALEAAADRPYWIARPIELPGSRPLRFEGGADVAVTLRQWPSAQTAKCLVFYHPDDAPEMKAEQDAQLLRLAEAARATRRELLLEVIVPGGKDDPAAAVRVIEHLYDIGIHPDWWKLEPAADLSVWGAIEAAIRRRDPSCRGVLVLGLSAPFEALEASFALAARAPIVKGFAVGRTIFHEVAAEWLTGRIDDEAATARLAANFARLVKAWRTARGGRAAA